MWIRPLRHTQTPGEALRKAIASGSQSRVRMAAMLPELPDRYSELERELVTAGLALQASAQLIPVLKRAGVRRDLIHRLRQCHRAILSKLCILRDKIDVLGASNVLAGTVYSECMREARDLKAISEDLLRLAGSTTSRGGPGVTEELTDEVSALELDVQSLQGNS